MRAYAPRRARRCKKCGSPIRFLHMDTGKWLPVDARPSELRGNVLVGAGGRSQLLSTPDARRMRGEGYDLYVSHWASCPGARPARADRGALDAGERERAAARKAAQRAFAAARGRQRESKQPSLFE